MRHVEDTVTFPPINAKWVLQPHEDALILTQKISGFDVKNDSNPLGQLN